MDLNIGLDVRAMQDPPRLAPGEVGQLILLVSVDKGSMVLPGGRVTIKKNQGPLTFGGPVWDPVPAGKKGYQDSFLIRIPITVASNAKFGSYSARGDLLVKGVFRNRDIVTELKPKKAAGKTSLNRGFQGPIVVGKPWPKPPKRHRKKTAKKPRTIPQPLSQKEGQLPKGSAPEEAKSGTLENPAGKNMGDPLGMTEPEEGLLQDPGELESPQEELGEDGGGQLKLLLGLALAGLGVVGIGVLFLRKR
jgi:hypothetical protein